MEDTIKAIFSLFISYWFFFVQSLIVLDVCACCYLLLNGHL